MGSLKIKVSKKEVMAWIRNKVHTDAMNDG
jgi:hypothetical protein